MEEKVCERVTEGWRGLRLMEGIARRDLMID